MATFLRNYLLVTGALAGVAMAAPFLVIVGFILGIAPGVVLALAPTAFLYGAAFAIGWRVARPRLGEVGGSLVGAALAAAVGFGAPSFVNRDVTSEIARLRADDREPAAPARPARVVRIEQEGALNDFRKGERRTYACDVLCLAALFTPGVTEVVLASAPQPAGKKPRREDLTATYRLARGEPGGAVCAGQSPLPDGPRRSFTWPDAGKALVAWKLALAGGGCVVRAPLEAAAPTADWTLRLESQWSIKLDGPSSLAPSLRFKRVTLAKGADTVLRQTEVGANTLQDALYVEPTGGKENFHLDWARRSVVEGAFDAADLLKRNTSLAFAPEGSADASQTGVDIRAALGAALDDPALPATAAAFTLVRPYFELFSAFRKPAAVTPGDAALSARIIADPRVGDLFGLTSAVLALGPDAKILRGPMASRLLASRYPQDRELARTIGHALASLPAGLFAEPTADESRLLGDEKRRRWAEGLVVRQADRGASAAPDLVRIIGEAYARPATKRSYDEPDRLDDARAAVRALCLLGPLAAGSLPDLTALAESGDATRRLLGDRSFQFMLARLGRPIESVVKPENMSGSQETFTANLRRRLERFQPQDCR